MKSATIVLGINIEKVGTVNVKIEKKSKKSVVVNGFISVLLTELESIKDIFKKFGDITKFEIDNYSESLTIHYENENSVNDVMTIPEGTVESIKVVPITMETIRKSRDSQYISDLDAVIEYAEVYLKKYYEEIRKPIENTVEDGWTVVSKKRKSMPNLMPNQESEEEEEQEEFDDDDEEIDSDI